MASERKIKILSGISSADSAWNTGDELVVGEDIPEEMAAALCLYPEHQPRAQAIGWDPATATREAEFAEDVRPDVRETTEAAPQRRRGSRTS